MSSKLYQISRTFALGIAAATTAGIVMAQSTSSATHPKITRGEPINSPVATQNSPAIPSDTTSPSAVKPMLVATQATLAPASDPTTAAQPLPSTNMPLAWDVNSLTRLGDYLNLGFDGLASFEYLAPDVAVKGPITKPDVADKFIPDYIKTLDGKKVIIKGFMIPLLVKDGAVVELLMMRNQSTCCYGTPPKITEFISVKISGKGVPALMDVPVNLAGTFHVGTERANGFITEIYRMDGEKLVDDSGK